MLPWLLSLMDVLPFLLGKTFNWPLIKLKIGMNFSALAPKRRAESNEMKCLLLAI